MRGALGGQFAGQLIDLRLLGALLWPASTCPRAWFIQRAGLDGGPPFLDVGVIEPFAAQDRTFGPVRCGVVFVNDGTFELGAEGPACLPITPWSLMWFPGVLVGWFPWSEVAGSC